MLDFLYLLLIVCAVWVGLRPGWHVQGLVSLVTTSLVMVGYMAIASAAAPMGAGIMYAFIVLIPCVVFTVSMWATFGIRQLWRMRR